MSKHTDAIDERRASLTKQTREELLSRRALLEAVVASPQADKYDWQHEVAADDDERPTVREQFDLISEALSNLPNPQPPQVVGLRDGLAILRTFGQGESHG